MTQNKSADSATHNLIMENRKKLTVSGVTQVDSFDEQTMVVYTTLGELTVKGLGLHMDMLSTETGDAVISGTIHGLMYTDERQKGGFWSRILR